MNESISRGYLLQPYRLFHSSDRRDADFDAHSHEFHKMVFCLQGHVTYIMEGNSYELQPGDMLLIPERQIHRSIMHRNTLYERMILWVNDSYLRSFNEETLRRPFRSPMLHRPSPGKQAVLKEKLTEMERCEKGALPGPQLMQDTYLLQFLLLLSGQLDAAGDAPANAVRTDPKVHEVLSYINGNLKEELSVDSLARRFFISPSYLMHSFKAHTGCSVHQYIVQKRLTYAFDRIRDGQGIVETAHQAGFGDYSAFLKAFRKQYGCSPREVK